MRYLSAIRRLMGVSSRRLRSPSPRVSSRKGGRVVLVSRGGRKRALYGLLV